MTKILKYMLLSAYLSLFSTVALARVTPIDEYNFVMLPDEECNFTSCADNGAIAPANKPDKTVCDAVYYCGNLCYKNCSCLDGYVSVNGVCTLNDCSAYPYTACPEFGADCSSCPTDGAKYAFTCKTASGWIQSGNKCVCNASKGLKQSGSECICNTSLGWQGTTPNCTAKSCTSGEKGVTSCSSGYEWRDGGYSGGEQCGSCVCVDEDPDCTAANYPLTSQPSIPYAQCVPGCGNNTVRYKILAETCEDLGYVTTVPNGQECTPLSTEIGTCYSNCKGNGYKCCDGKRYLSGVYNTTTQENPECTDYYESGEIIPSTISGPTGVGGYANCNYVGISDYDDYEYVKNFKASGNLNFGNVIVVPISEDLNFPDTDVVFDYNYNSYILMPPQVGDGYSNVCSVGNTIAPPYTKIFAKNFTIVNGGITGVDLEIVDTVSLKDTNLSNMKIIANKLYIEGTVYFREVELLVGDIYIKNGANIIFTSANNRYIPNYCCYITYDGGGCQWNHVVPAHLLPRYSNTWGSATAPIAFHKLGDGEGAIIMTPYAGEGYGVFNEGVIIYGYNASNAPIFTELYYTPIGFTSHPGDQTLTTKFRMIDIKGISQYPLFRKMHTFGMDNTTNRPMTYISNLELNGGLTDVGGSKISSICNAIKNNSYLSVANGETCSLQSAKDYVTCNAFDTTECKNITCENMGMYSENEDDVEVWRSTCDSTHEYYDADYATEWCFEQELDDGHYTPIATNCDGQKWTDEYGEEHNWQKCYKREYVYCLDNDDDYTEEDKQYSINYGWCSNAIYNNESYDADIQCAEITDNDDPEAICQELADKRTEEYGPSDQWYIELSSITYSTADYITNTIDETTNSSGKKCLICNLHGTYPNRRY